VIARGWNLRGEPVTVSGTDLLARCLQHETDHLDGILFIDRLDPADREAALAEIAAADWSGDLAPVVRLSPHSTPNPPG
jgi:peptide deformylase